jgi:hypothetical protein
MLIKNKELNNMTQTEYLNTFKDKDATVIINGKEHLGWIYDIKDEFAVISLDKDNSHVAVTFDNVITFDSTYESLSSWIRIAKVNGWIKESA